MNKTITIYDLLGLIKDGKAPNKIKLNKVIFNYTGDDYLYKENNEEYWLFSSGYTDKYMWLKNFLDAEIEILDEEDEFIKIEDIEIGRDYSDETTEIIAKWYQPDINDLQSTINALIHNQKILIERLENDK